MLGNRLAATVIAFLVGCSTTRPAPTPEFNVKTAATAKTHPKVSPPQSVRAGCSKITRTKEKTPMESPLTLEVVKVEASSRLLGIRAKLTNSGALSVFYVRHLLNGWNNSGVPITESSAAYRVVRDGRLVLVRSFVPVPEDMSLEVVQYPLFEELKAGTSTDLLVEVPLPTHPYIAWDMEEFNPKSARLKSLPWSLEIGFIDAKKFLAEGPKMVTTTSGERGLEVFSLDQAAIACVRYDSDINIPVQVPLTR
jgi:hypothetical protein